MPRRKTPPPQPSPRRRARASALFDFFLVFDRLVGRDAQWIEYHPAYRELERAAFGEFGIHAMSLRKGIMGWREPYPVVAKHAFTFLFNQAEFGLGCPINVTDGCAKLLSKFGSEALKARYLDGLTQTDMSKLTQGGQFMTEKEGGSDVGTLTTTAVPEGDHWRLTGEKWFCSNADAEVVMLLEAAGPENEAAWQYAFARATSGGLEVKLGTAAIWTAEKYPANRGSTAPQLTVRRPLE